MSDLVRMSPEDFEHAKEQVRMTLTAKYKQVLDSLEPYVDGSFGSIQPAHVTAYLKAGRELGLLWKSYDQPAGVEEVKGPDEELMVLSARQEAVLAELAKLRQIGQRRKAS
jgi:hypothetical protein